MFGSLQWKAMNDKHVRLLVWTRNSYRRIMHHTCFPTLYFFRVPLFVLLATPNTFRSNMFQQSLPLTSHCKHQLNWLINTFREKCGREILQEKHIVLTCNLIIKHFICRKATIFIKINHEKQSFFLEGFPASFLAKSVDQLI